MEDSMLIKMLNSILIKGLKAKVYRLRNEIDNPPTNPDLLFYYRKGLPNLKKEYSATEKRLHKEIKEMDKMSVEEIEKQLAMLRSGLGKIKVNSFMSALTKQCYINNIKRLEEYLELKSTKTLIR